MTILFSVLVLKNKFTCILRKFFIEKSKSFRQIENNENNDYKIKKPLELSFQRTLYVREKIRTPDTLVRSQVLYPAELRTHIFLSWHSTNAGDRNRTGTVFLQQDFKSCASASSATPACNYEWDQ